MLKEIPTINYNGLEYARVPRPEALVRLSLPLP